MTTILSLTLIVAIGVLITMFGLLAATAFGGVIGIIAFIVGCKTAPLMPDEYNQEGEV